MKIKKTVEEGAEVPRGYGFAWRNWMTGETVALPLGLNKLAGWTRWLYHWVLWKVRPSVLEQARIAGLNERWKEFQAFRDSSDKHAQAQYDRGLVDGYNQKALEIAKALDDYTEGKTE